MARLTLLVACAIALESAHGLADERPTDYSPVSVRPGRAIPVAWSVRNTPVPKGAHRLVLNNPWSGGSGKMAFSPDGQWLAMARGQGPGASSSTIYPGAVWIWNLKEWRHVKTVESPDEDDWFDHVESLAVSPDGGHLAVSWAGSIRIYSFPEGTELSTVSKAFHLWTSDGTSA